MASFIKEQDGLRWFDEAYTTSLTNQGRDQLRKKVAAGKLRSLPGADGEPQWFAEPDVDALRAAYLKRKASMVGRQPSLKQWEKKWAHQPKTKPEPERYVPMERRGEKKMLWRMLARPPMPRDGEE